MLFVHALRGQYDDQHASVAILWQLQVAFKNQWQRLHLFSDTIVGLNWNYAIPSFMFHSLLLLFYLFHV